MILQVFAPKALDDLLDEVGMRLAMLGIQVPGWWLEDRQHYGPTMWGLDKLVYFITPLPIRSYKMFY